jgi:hypothetical protein
VRETSPQRYDTQNLPPISLRSSWEGNDFPTPRILRSGDGFPDRVDRIKSLGNAIVPAVALEIFKAIEQSEIGWHKEHFSKLRTYGR